MTCVPQSSPSFLHVSMYTTDFVRPVNVLLFSISRFLYTILLLTVHNHFSTMSPAHNQILRTAYRTYDNIGIGLVNVLLTLYPHGHNMIIVLILLIAHINKYYTSVYWVSMLWGYIMWYYFVQNNKTLSCFEVLLYIILYTLWIKVVHSCWKKYGFLER